MKRIVILISGRGSNMRGHRAALRGRGLAGAVVAVVSATAPTPPGCLRGERGIATAVVDHKRVSPRARPSMPRWREAIDAHRPTWWCWPASCASWATASCAATPAGC
jgi:folate-dependent phosphoribosylglycinamide formyltransferase PurN